MAQGKHKLAKVGGHMSIMKKKRDARHGRLNKEGKHHFSQPKPEKTIQKNKDGNNNPEKLGKIYNKEIQKTVQKKINDHQKKIYKSIEQKIIEKARKNKETLDIL